MKLKLFFLFSMLYVSISCSNTESKNELAFYVSPEGSDTQNGKSAETAFATLEKARNAIRELKQSKELDKTVTVYLQGGTYQLSKPFVLTAEDSGTEEFPITYSAYKNEEPIISGGLKVRNWTETKLNDYDVLVSDLSNLEGYAPFEQLWVNSHRAIQARTPNSGYLKVPLTQGEDTKEVRRSSTYDFSYLPTDEHYLKDVNEGVAVVFNKWLEYHMPIDSIDRQNHKIVATKKVVGPLKVMMITI